MADAPLPTGATRPGVAYVGVGSNIRPLENVARALDLLNRRLGVNAVSTFYRTAPVGAGDVADFVNGVVCLAADPAVDRVAQVLADVEAALGRQRGSDRYASRVIDLDLLLDPRDGGTVHPDVMERGFVALPLLELAPDLVLPAGVPLSEAARGFRHPPGEPLDEFTARLRLDLGG